MNTSPLRLCVSAFAAFCCVLSVAAADIWMAGDSTMSPYGGRYFPQQGWGQRLQDFCVEGVKVHDLAVGGRSSKSFIFEGRWDKLLAGIKPGDFVIIAFGHNDAPPKKSNKNPYRVKRSSSPAEFKTNFVKFATEVRAKGATPVFATSIIHSGGISHDASGKTTVRAGAAGIGPYVQATRDLAKELNIGLLDLNAYAEKEFATMGADTARLLYIHLKPGEYPNYPKGREDNCHICDKGAVWYAQAAAYLACSQQLAIAKLFKSTAAPVPPTAAPTRAASVSEQAPASAAEDLDPIAAKETATDK